MFTVCWGAKGGSGTTVVAATLAMSYGSPSLLVDLAGDLPLALGVATPPGPGLAEWSLSTAPADRIDALRVPLTPDLELIPRGHSEIADRWRSSLDTSPGSVTTSSSTPAPVPRPTTSGALRIGRCW